MLIIPTMIGTFFPYLRTQQLIKKESDKTLNFAIDQMATHIQYKMVAYATISNALLFDYQIERFLGTQYEEKNKAYSMAYNINEDFKKIIYGKDEIYSFRIYKNNLTIPEITDFILDEMRIKDKVWYKQLMEKRGISYWKTDNIQNEKVISVVTLIGKNATNYQGILETNLRLDKRKRQI